MKYSELERKSWLDKMRMTAKRIRSMTPEERNALASRMPIVTCEGHTLSMFNAAFLSLQTDSTLTMVGGFRQWGKVGRHVRKGDHAAGYIYVPLGVKRDNPSPAGPETVTEANEMRFRLMPVFDVSQTDEGTVARAEDAA